jgi:hypothetical protein
MKTNKITELINKYQNLRIKSINEIKQITHDIQELRIYCNVMENYRGHSLVEYKLNSGLARYDYPSDKLNEIERKIYDDFSKLFSTKKDYIRQPFTDKYENSELRNKWYSLFQAQHIGLKTRLMDWSLGWETALMFAVENEKYFGQDGTLTVFLVPDELLFGDDKFKQFSSAVDPFQLEQDMMINTPIYMLDDKFDYVGERRISRQSGRFWVQSIEKGAIPLKEQGQYKDLLLEIIIDGESKETIKKEMEEYGVTIDWHYYRKDENIDVEIKKINERNLEI